MRGCGAAERLIGVGAHNTHHARSIQCAPLDQGRLERSNAWCASAARQLCPCPRAPPARRPPFQLPERNLCSLSTLLRYANICFCGKYVRGATDAAAVMRGGFRAASRFGRSSRCAPSAMHVRGGQTRSREAQEPVERRGAPHMVGPAAAARAAGTCTPVRPPQRAKRRSIRSAPRRGRVWPGQGCACQQSQL